MVRAQHGLALVALVLGIAAPVQAQAATVSFSGAVVNTCVINISTPGVLALASTGTMLSSEETGGANAVVAVIATGTAPALLFGAPALTGPAASTAGAVTTLGYTSPGGASQALTSGTSTYTMTRLLDTLSVKAHANNTNGFVSGTYGISSTVTCQQ
jgi:hypothetical protein